MPMDIASNRRASKWSRKELAGRLLWSCCAPLFRWSPRLCWGWRCALLRLFGARIGRNVQIHPSVRVFIPWNLEVGDWTSFGFDVLLYNLGPLKIGEKVTISQRAHLCGGSHDFRDPGMRLIKEAITVGSEVWICADAFVGPSVVLGEGSVIAARAVVVKEVAPWTVVGGNPARILSQRRPATSSETSFAQPD